MFAKGPIAASSDAAVSVSGLGSLEHRFAYVRETTARRISVRPGGSPRECALPLIGGGASVELFEPRSIDRPRRTPFDPPAAAQRRKRAAARAARAGRAPRSLVDAPSEPEPSLDAPTIWSEQAVRTWAAQKARRKRGGGAERRTAARADESDDDCDDDADDPNLRHGEGTTPLLRSLLDATRDEYAKVWNAPLPREATSLLADAYAGLRAKEEMEKRRRLRARDDRRVGQQRAAWARAGDAELGASASLPSLGGARDAADATLSTMVHQRNCAEAVDSVLAAGECDGLRFDAAHLPPHVKEQLLTMAARKYRANETSDVAEALVLETVADIARDAVRAEVYEVESAFLAQLEVRARKERRGARRALVALKALTPPSVSLSTLCRAQADHPSLAGVTMPDLRAELRELERRQLARQRKLNSRGSSRSGSRGGSRGGDGAGSSRPLMSREADARARRVDGDARDAESGGLAALHPLRRRQKLLRRVAEARMEAMVCELGLDGHVRPWTKIVRGDNPSPFPSRGLSREGVVRGASRGSSRGASSGASRGVSPDGEMPRGRSREGRARSRQGRRQSGATNSGAAMRLAAVREEIELRLADAERSAAEDFASQFDTLSSLRDAVRAAGGDVATPGKHGDERRRELALRLHRLVAPQNGVT